MMLEILRTVVDSPDSRFFRQEADITKQPGNVATVVEYMDLAIIRERITSNIYKTSEDMKKDMQLIASNAVEQHGSMHPVGKTAAPFLDTYFRASVAAIDRLVPMLATG